MAEERGRGLGFEKGPNRVERITKPCDAQILIEEVDPREADREEAERRAEQERRVRDQEKATEHMRRLQLHQQEEARDSASRAASGGAGHP